MKAKVEKDVTVTLELTDDEFAMILLGVTHLTPDEAKDLVDYSYGEYSKLVDDLLDVEI